MARHPDNPGARGLPLWGWVALVLFPLLVTGIGMSGLFLFQDSPSRTGVPEPSVDFGPVPPGYRALTVPAPPTRLIDGDTFEVDLDGDGELSLPLERVRLLFVDTPELGKSWKGQDRAHGLPAKDFLEAALERGPLRLLIPLDRPTGNYGRTLAVVQAVTQTGERSQSVNLSLIRSGHGYWDTRFGFPPGYDAYQQAEGEAFDQRAGIWGDAASRAKYLKRSRREGRTPAARSNPAFVKEAMAATAFRPEDLEGKFLRLEGTLRRVQRLRKGVRLLRLERGRGHKTFPAVAFRNTAQHLGLQDWPSGSKVRLEGFIKPYKGKPQMVIHFGRLLK